MNVYFDHGIPPVKSVPLPVPAVAQVKVQVNDHDHENTLYYIGRRNVNAYSLQRGYGLRVYILHLEIDNNKIGDNCVAKGGPTSTNSRKLVDIQHQNNQIYNNVGKSGSSQQNSITSFLTSSTSSNQQQQNYHQQASRKENSITNVNNKQKQHKNNKFIAAELLFRCGPSGHVEKGVKGRLPNWLCAFLLPLLRAGLIVVKGHIAYDIGHLAVFQDVPLSIQVSLCIFICMCSFLVCTYVYTRVYLCNAYPD